MPRGRGSYKWLGAGRAAVRRRVLLTRGIHAFAVEGLRRRHDVEVHAGRVPMPRGRLLASLARADGLLCFPYDRIDAEAIDAAPRLAAISTYSVGHDHIDAARARARGIRVGYTPDVLSDATADLAVALMLDATRRVTEGDRAVRAGRWRRMYGAEEFLGAEASGMSLGVVGMGRIGRRVASRAAALGMRVAYCGRRAAPVRWRRMGLAALLARSDVVSLHVPYTPQTHHMIGAAQLAAMRPGAYLVNTSRGRVVDERALVAALRARRIAGAALDVFESEPIGRSHPLCRMGNVVLTPHIGSSTARARRRMAEIAVANLEAGLAGRRPPFPVPRGGA